MGDQALQALLLVAVPGMTFHFAAVRDEGLMNSPAFVSEGSGHRPRGRPVGWRKNKVCNVHIHIHIHIHIVCIYIYIYIYIYIEWGRGECGRRQQLDTGCGGGLVWRRQRLWPRKRSGSSGRSL